MSKETIEFIRKKGVFYFTLKFDKQKDMDTLMAYRKNPPKEDGTLSSLVILARMESELYPMMNSGEWWEVEYDECDKGTRSYAQATPLRRATLISEAVQKTKNGPLGYCLRAGGVADNEDGTIFLKLFPKDRKYTKVIEEVIKAKIKKRGLEIYADDILQGFSDTLHAISLVEVTASETSLETVKHIKDMDPEEYEGETRQVTELSILSKINKEISFQMDNLPEPTELACDIINKYGILEYSPHLSQFKVKAQVKDKAKVTQ